MDAKTLGIILSIVGPVLSFMVWAFPDSRISRILLTWFGPSPMHFEPRSSFLIRQAAFAAVWLVFLAAIGGAIFLAVQEGYLVFYSQTAFIVVSFMLAIVLGIAALAMIGAFTWAITLRVFRRDWTYVLESELPDNIPNEIHTGNNE
ncbi:MAG TPA: hypothetical protein PKK10_17425 [Woeseiaceae bacterium]|nr:hypothetical protein [Woeseiaceae bacterium]